mgnify:CR=1 FL=1
MKKVLLLVFFKSGLVVSKCEALVPITWTAYGLTFEAPKGILVEEDTEETFLLNNSRFLYHHSVFGFGWYDKK